MDASEHSIGLTFNLSSKKTSMNMVQKIHTCTIVLTTAGCMVLRAFLSGPFPKSCIKITATIKWQLRNKYASIDLYRLVYALFLSPTFFANTNVLLAKFIELNHLWKCHGLQSEYSMSILVYCKLGNYRNSEKFAIFRDLDEHLLCKIKRFWNRASLTLNQLVHQANNAKL